MKKNKGDLLSFVFGIILLIIVVLTAFIAFTNSSSKPALNDTSENKVRILPTLSPTPSLNSHIPPVAYNEIAQDKLLDKIVNRIPLSDNDTFAKATILSTLPKENPSGILYQSDTIIIDFTNNANMFQVEILTTDISAAKAEANVWFRARGMSQKGICDLPVLFYLNSDTMTKLRGTGTIFSPLANSC